MKDDYPQPARESASTCVRLQGAVNPPRRILVVDNDGDVRRLSVEVLKGSGYDVDVAENSTAGWEVLHANDYDLLITDNETPNFSGVELLRKLRASRMALWVIVTTGALPVEEFMRYPWCLAPTTLLQPYTNDELLQTVRQVLHVTDVACE